MRRGSDAGGAVAPRRICFVLTSNTWGGAEIHTLNLVAALVDRGHRVTIVELDEPVISERRMLLADGVEVRTVRLADTLPQLAFAPTYRFLRRLHADVGVLVKGWTTVGNLALDLACRLAFRNRFLSIEHSTPPRRPAKTSRRHLRGIVPGLGLWWHGQGLRIRVRSLFPKRIVAVSHAVAGELVRYYGFPACKVVAIPNGIDGERFAPDPAARARARAEWGVPAGAVVFGTLGRLSILDKGLDIAIDLFGRLCAANPDRPLWCVLVGAGREEATLRAQAQSSGWGSRFVFPGPTERPWEACCGMDVLLMPSRYEGLGFALLEGMACGCCPVVMGVGGINDIVTDATLGWVAPPDDREAFLRGMQAALDLGPDGRAAMGARSRQHVLRHFRAAEQYGKLADLIEGTVA